MMSVDINTNSMVPEVEPQIFEGYVWFVFLLRSNIIFPSLDKRSAEMPAWFEKFGPFKRLSIWYDSNISLTVLLNVGTKVSVNKLDIRCSVQ